jgi:hypothetical protein
MEQIAGAILKEIEAYEKQGARLNRLSRAAPATPNYGRGKTCAVSRIESAKRRAKSSLKSAAPLAFRCCEL